MAPATAEPVELLVELGEDQQARGDVTGALETYGRALLLATSGSQLERELSSRIAELEARTEKHEENSQAPEVAQAALLAASEQPSGASEAPIEDEDARREDAELARHFDEGLHYYDQDNWAQAQKAFSEVVRRRPDYEREGRSAAKLLELSELFALGLAAYKQGNWAEARDLLAKVLQWGPDDARHHDMAVQLLADVDAHLSKSNNPVGRAVPAAPADSRAKRWSLFATAGLIILVAILVFGPMRKTVFGSDSTPEASVLPIAGSAPTEPTAPSATETPGATTPVALVAPNAASSSEGAGPSSASSVAEPTFTAATSAGADTTPLPTFAEPTAPPTAPAAITAPPSPTPAQEIAEVPTALPTEAPSPTAAAPPVEAVLKQVAAAEAALRSGSLVASIGDSQNSRSTAEVNFDLGDQQRPPRFYLKTTYNGEQSSQIVEYIMIASQSWQRPAGGNWVEGPAQEAAWAQVQSFLPGVALVAKASLESDGETLHSAGTMPSGMPDVSVEVDPAAGVPLNMERVSRGTKSVLRVTYTGWNKPVTISAPDTSG